MSLTALSAGIAGHEWPLRSSLPPLGPFPTAVSCARAHAAQVMCEWGMRSVADTVELVVSELMTNAVTASRAKPWTAGRTRSACGCCPIGSAFWFWYGTRARIRLCAWNRTPAQRPAGGLMLVDAVSADWNWYAAQWDRIEGEAGMGADIRRLSKLEQAVLRLVQSSEHPHSAKTAHRYLDYPVPITVIAVRRALPSLAEKGHLARRQGYGRSVVMPPPLRNLGNVSRPVMKVCKAVPLA